MPDADIQIKSHGDHQLELVVNYPLEADVKKRHLVLDLHFFIPRQLGVNRKSWSADKFYRALSVYTRYKTPAVPLKQLVSSKCQDSPLYRIRDIFRRNGNYHHVEDRILVGELRALLNIIEHHNSCLKRQPGSDIPALLSIADDMKTVQISLDDLSGEFLHPDSTAELKKSYDLCREGISLQIEKAAGRIYESLQTPGTGQADSSHKSAARGSKSCIQHIREQQDYRRFHDFSNNEDPLVGRNTEESLYREHEIKKWGHQDLYLSSRSSSLISRLVQLLFAVAAAAAMSVAILASLFSMKFFESGSPAWALIAISAYILKDRIKDGLRAFFLYFIPNYYADRVKKLINPATGEKGGSFRERLSFPKLSELSPDQQYSRVSAARPESILHYRKKTTICSSVLLETQEDMAALSDIFRLEISGWLNRMDKAVETVYSLEGDVLRPSEVSRTYRIPVQVSLSSDAGTLPLLRSYLLVLDSRGIRRIEESTLPRPGLA